MGLERCLQSSLSFTDFELGFPSVPPHITTQTLLWNKHTDTQTEAHIESFGEVPLEEEEEEEEDEDEETMESERGRE